MHQLFLIFRNSYLSNERPVLESIKIATKRCCLVVYSSIGFTGKKYFARKESVSYKSMPKIWRAKRANKERAEPGRPKRIISRTSTKRCHTQADCFRDPAVIVYE